MGQLRHNTIQYNTSKTEEKSWLEIEKEGLWKDRRVWRLSIDPYKMEMVKKEK
jgi:hypothetical protein